MLQFMYLQVHKCLHYIGIGAQNCAKIISPEYLSRCIERCCYDPTAFYPPEFEILATRALFVTLHIKQQDITVHNCKYVYCWLAVVLDALVNV